MPPGGTGSRGSAPRMRPNADRRPGGSPGTSSARQWGRAARRTRKGWQSMKVGVPKEVKNHEDRVAITPSGAHELVRTGHQVFIEAGAGNGSAIPDKDFVAAGG